ncbi:type II toxin-antitoxin system RelE/ParE family toxin [uncultured Limnohabitans sp.]|uniref:type II toxin-antitoxin system RelE/ParE family toxin n=1 Tax=uncultured Limnohabitans sp. TaxID=768543 RepID=UPI00343F75B7
MLDLRWTHRALDRLDEIASFIAKDNPARAQTFVTELRDKLEILRTNQLGRAGRVFGTKELVLHKHYLAVYRVKGKGVQVLTILHTAQNP